MAVVIRLQGLPVVAGSSDIRRFFSGLKIPDGGVHIIGGEKGEAFVIFATDEDARQGMSFSGELLKDSRIELFLSSKTEMQNLIEVNRKRYEHGGRETGTESRRASSSNSGVGSLSNLVAAIKKGIGKSSYGSPDHMEDDFNSDGSHNSNTEGSNQSKKESFDELCVFIRGMPYSATENDVLNFFSGLKVEEVTMIEKEGGLASGDGVVKFATLSDAKKALQRDLEFMGKRFIEVSPFSPEVQVKLGRWLNLNRRGGKGTGHSFKHFAQLNRKSSSRQERYSRRESNYMPSRKRSHSQSPPRRRGARSRSISASRRYLSRSRSRSLLRRYMARSRSRSPLRRYLARSHSRSPLRYLARSHSRSPLRRYLARSRSRSSRRAVARSRSGSRQRTYARFSSPLSHSTLPRSSYSGEYYIHIKNLPPDVEKRDLRVFFGTLDIVNRHITLLKPYNHEKQRDAFVQLTTSADYQAALGYHKSVLLGQEIHIFPISKNKILKIIGSSERKRSHERHQHAKEKKGEYSGPKNCVYVRNFPYDVTNVEVQKFFVGFNIDDSDIYLLHDDKGTGLGEALVRFRSEDQARKAESLNRRRFLGTEVLLRCIPEEQMQEFGIGITSVSSEKPHAYARSEHLYAVDSHGPSISSEGPPVQENLNHLPDYRCSDEFLCPPDHFRGPPPFPGFSREANPGGFHEGHFIPDSNFAGGADRITLIKMKGLPFRVSPNEILDFFHGYKIIPESLSILTNEYGMPSGEATLALVNYHEALAAVNELNDRPFGHRKVRLILV